MGIAQNESTGRSINRWESTLGSCQLATGYEDLSSRRKTLAVVNILAASHTGKPAEHNLKRIRRILHLLLNLEPVSILKTLSEPIYSAGISMTIWKPRSGSARSSGSLPSLMRSFGASLISQAVIQRSPVYLNQCYRRDKFGVSRCAPGHIQAARGSAAADRRPPTWRKV